MILEHFAVFLLVEPFSSVQFFFGFASEWDIDTDQTNINRERRQLAVYPELWSSHMHCRANDSWTFKENIAQGTTDPRVEFILPK